jgi:hypothetical protein
MNEQQKRAHDALPISKRPKCPVSVHQLPKVEHGRTLEAIRREEASRKR